VELKETAKVGLNIKVEKTKVMVQCRRTRTISEILTIKDHDIEVVRRFIYLGIVISNSHD
jgi:hypothetical protein